MFLTFLTFGGGVPSRTSVSKFHSLQLLLLRESEIIFQGRKVSHCDIFRPSELPVILPAREYAQTSGTVHTKKEQERERQGGMWRVSGKAEKEESGAHVSASILSLFLSSFLPTSIYPSIYLSIYLSSIYPFIRVSVFLSIHLSIQRISNVA